MSQNELSTKIKSLREKHGLTLEEVARHVGVGKSTVRKWETGMIENMRRDKIAKLAEALYTTPGYLMGWDEKKDSSIGIKDLPLWVTDDSFMDHFPNNIFSPLREIREARGITQQEAADGIGISLNYYNSIESGHNADCITLFRIATFFNHSPDFIVAFDGVFPESAISHQDPSLLRLHSILSRLTPEQQEAVIAYAQGLLDAPRLTLRMAGRDGSHEERRLSKEEAAEMKAKWEQAPKVPEDL